jgi:DNA/RNA endonuclease YhcR with UshA esterase domain
MNERKNKFKSRIYFLIMQKNFLALISFLTSVLGLILIYIAAINIKPVQIEISQITPDLIGRSVSIQGIIKEKKIHTEGHMFLVISDGESDIQVPIFSSLMKDLKNENLTEVDFEVNRKFSVTGLVDEYNGNLQVLPRKTSDIKLGD